LEAELEEGREALKKSQDEVEDRTAWARRLEAELEEGREALKQSQEEIEERIMLLNQEANMHNRHISELQGQLLEKESLIAEKESKIGLLSEKVANYDVQIAERDHDLYHLRRYLDLVKSSWSWRLTAPLRAIQEKANSVIQTLKRYRLATWIIWTHRKTGVFDPVWYLENNPDVRKSALNPWWHFAVYGVYEGRAPNRRFHPEPYTILNHDVARSGIVPALHFILFGYREERISNWLDRNTEFHHGRVERMRLSNLLDVLLMSETEAPVEAKAREKQKVLLKRLKKALQYKGKTSIVCKVTVIIPAYNQLIYTLACLISLFESKPETSFEVIIADDCSTDETSIVLLKLSDFIRVIRTPGNLGFLKNCNHASKHVRTKTLVFLNNDMIVFPGWLDNLIETLLKDESNGMVGSKLLNLNGTLQEAGGIFWNDGSAWNYGRNEDPERPEFNYKKEVDYCSGASISLRKEVWDAVGGFDEIYAPAYCEESDLSFRLRERGLKTIYQPFSVGIHLEGVSCGTDASTGIKGYQIRNLERLQRRWDKILQSNHFPNAENLFLARDRTRHKKHMVFIDHYVPRPDQDAGSKQMETYIKHFSESGYHVTFWPDNQYWCIDYAQPLQKYGVEVINSMSGPIDFSKWIQENGKYIDTAFLSRPHIAVRYFDEIRQHTKARIIFYGHDLHQVRRQLELQLDPDNEIVRSALNIDKALEEECWEKADLVMYPSQEECEFVEEKKPGVQTCRLPLYCMKDESFEKEKTPCGFESRSGLLFVGGFAHHPNKDAMLWFAEKIQPLLRAKIPNLKLTIAGSHPTEEIFSLSDEWTEITGGISVQRLRELYSTHLVAIAPLRFGAGVKGKVIESMAKGLPIVTTSIGIQGLSGCCDAISSADNETDFANEVIELYSNKDKWSRQREAGFEYVYLHFNQQAVNNTLTTSGVI
jgi:GT2 family glycosyltransferase